MKFSAPVIELRRAISDLDALTWNRGPTLAALLSDGVVRIALRVLARALTSSAIGPNLPSLGCCWMRLP